MKKILLVITHLATLAAGFALGVYLLPIIIAPPAPTAEQVAAASSGAAYTTQFRRDLPGSDALHWGEGEVSISKGQISLMGSIAPGPDYKLYLSPKPVETAEEFMSLKDSSVRVADVKTFENFIVDVPSAVNPDEYTTVVIWCETFEQFITAGSYR